LTDLRAELLGVETAIIDGELIACGDDGKPDFLRLQHRLRTTSWQRVRSLGQSVPVCLVAFDCLYLNGDDLRGLPLIERKEPLREIIPPGQEHIVYAQHWDAAQGEALYRLICEQRLEGVVVKDKTSPYISRRPNWKWLKAKTPFARGMRRDWIKA
jgi:bifunctional non-homologous end joining protein LigD